jgi:hypothetical protein
MTRPALGAHTTGLCDGVSLAFESVRETDMFESTGVGPTVPPSDVTPLRGIVTGIDLRSLPRGTAVVVDTRNARYRFVMLDGNGRNALIEGGPYFPQQAIAQVEGSALGGSVLKVGWIGLGFSVELSFGGKRIITSRVRSISVPKPGRDEHSPRS